MNNSYCFGVSCLKYCMRYTYNYYLLLVCNLNFTGHPVFLFAKFGNPQREKECVNFCSWQWDPRLFFTPAVTVCSRRSNSIQWTVCPTLTCRTSLNFTPSAMPAPPGQCTTTPRSLDPSGTCPPPSSETLAPGSQCPVHRSLSFNSEIISISSFYSLTLKDGDCYFLIHEYFLLAYSVLSQLTSNSL